MPLKLMGYAIQQSQKAIVTRHENDSREFVSSIEDSNPRGLSITIPLQNQVAMELRRGEEIYVKVPTPSFVMEFRTKVRSFTPDNVILINLEPPEDFKRIQRRGSFRLKILLNVEIAPLPDYEDQDPVFKPATALDLSAGGMEVVATTPYDKDSLVWLKFHLAVDKKTVHTFRLQSRVRRVAQTSPRKYKLGLEFQELSKADTDKIFQFIFKKSAEKDFWRK